MHINIFHMLCVEKLIQPQSVPQTLQIILVKQWLHSSLTNIFLQGLYATVFLLSLQFLPCNISKILEKAVSVIDGKEVDLIKARRQSTLS